MAKPNYNFKAHIHRSADKQFYSTLVGLNGEPVYTSETRTRRTGILKTVNRLFPGVIIVDETKKK